MNNSLESGNGNSFVIIIWCQYTFGGLKSREIKSQNKKSRFDHIDDNY